MEIVPQNGYLKVKVVPRSNTTQLKESFTDPDGDLVYKITLKAVPEKGKANTELVRFLSKSLKIPRQNITIISGKSSRTKLLKISND